jgi:hypothetical protein
MFDPAAKMYDDTEEAIRSLAAMAKKGIFI